MSELRTPSRHLCHRTPSNREDQGVFVAEDSAGHGLQTDLVGQGKMAEAGWFKPTRRGHQGSGIQRRHQANQTRRLRSPSPTFGHSSERGACVAIGTVDYTLSIWIQQRCTGVVTYMPMRRRQGWHWCSLTWVCTRTHLYTRRESGVSVVAKSTWITVSSRYPRLSNCRKQSLRIRTDE